MQPQNILLQSRYNFFEFTHLCKNHSQTTELIFQLVNIFESCDKIIKINFNSIHVKLVDQTYQFKLNPKSSFLKSYFQASDQESLRQIFSKVIINTIKIYFITIYAVFIAKAYLSSSNCILDSEMSVLQHFSPHAGGTKIWLKYFRTYQMGLPKTEWGGML